MLRQRKILILIFFLFFFDVVYGCERPEIKKEIKGKIEPPMTDCSTTSMLSTFFPVAFSRNMIFLNDFISLLRRVFSSKEYDY